MSEEDTTGAAASNSTCCRCCRCACCKRYTHKIVQQDEPRCLAPLWFYRRRAQTCVASLCALMFGILGACLIYAAEGTFEIKMSYDSLDSHVSFTIEHDLAGPFHLSYEIPSLFVNHKTFVKSKDAFLLDGWLTDYQCDGAEHMEDVKSRRCPTGANCSKDRLYALVESSGAFRPCGLVAMSMFTDTFELTNTDDGTNITLDQSGVALPADEAIYSGKFVKEGSHFTVEGVRSWLHKGPLYEHFKVWYRTSPSLTVRNLWATFDGPLKAGNYQVRLPENDAIWTDAWISTTKPKKLVILSQAHVLGSVGVCKLIGSSCVVICCSQVGLAIVFFQMPWLRARLAAHSVT